MAVNWYNVGNKKTFLEKGIPQESFVVDLEDKGETEIVFINGFNFSVIFNGRMMTPALNGRNPYYTGESTCYVDEENGEVWVGYEISL